MPWITLKAAGIVKFFEPRQAGCNPSVVVDLQHLFRRQPNARACLLIIDRSSMERRCSSRHYRRPFAKRPEWSILAGDLVVRVLRIGMKRGESVRKKRRNRPCDRAAERAGAEKFTSSAKLISVFIGLCQLIFRGRHHKANRMADIIIVERPARIEKFD